MYIGDSTEAGLFSHVLTHFKDDAIMTFSRLLFEILRAEWKHAFPHHVRCYREGWVSEKGVFQL